MSIFGKNRELRGRSEPKAAGPSRRERVDRTQKSFEEGFIAGITEDVKTTAQGIAALDAITGDAETKGEKEGAVSLRQKALHAVKRFLQFSSNITLVGLLAMSVDYYSTRNTIEKKKRMDGSVEYAHPDKETTHILNVLAGRENISFDEALKNFKAIVRIWADARHIRLIEDFDGYTLDQMDAYWKSIYDTLNDNHLPFSLKRHFYNFYYPEDLLIEHERAREIYDLVWRAEEECGSPNIRFQISGPSVLGVAFSDDVSRPYYNPVTNTVYVPLTAFGRRRAGASGNFLAELSHSKQFNENPLGAYGKVMGLAFRVFGKGGLNVKKLSDAQLEEYDISGSLEHEAHTKIEKDLLEKYGEIKKVEDMNVKAQDKK